MATPNNLAADPESHRARLSTLRECVGQLHKAILAAERTAYEANIGQISSSYHFLQLLTSDPWFAWLAPITHLLADLDAALDAKKPLTTAGTAALEQRAKSLLTPTETGEGFSRQYDEVLQRDPDVLYAHALTMRHLKTSPTQRFSPNA